MKKVPIQDRSGAQVWVKNSARYYLLLATSVLSITILVNLPAILPVFGRLDDYFLLRISLSGQLLDLFSKGLQEGRPVAAGLNSWMFSQVQSVEDLRWLRLTATVWVGLGGVTLAIFASMIQTNVPKTLRFGFSIFAGLVPCMLPASGSAATWGVMAGIMVTFPLAMSAGLVACLWSTMEGSRRLGAGLVVVLLIFGASLSYQHFVFLALLFPAFAVGKAWAESSTSLRSQARGLVLVAVTIVASLAVSLALVSRMGGAAADRLAGEYAWSQRFAWWLTEFVPRTLDLDVRMYGSLTPASIGLAAAVVAICVASCVWLAPRYLAVLGSVLLVWLISLTARLPVGELWSSFRAAHPSQLLLWSGLALLVVGLLPMALARRQELAGRVVLGFAVLLFAAELCMILGNTNRSYSLLTEPNAADWRNVSCEVASHSQTIEDSYIVVNPYSASTSPVVALDEFGVIGSSVTWSLASMIWLAKHDLEAPSSPWALDDILVAIERGQSLTGDTVSPLHRLEATERSCSVGPAAG